MTSIETLESVKSKLTPEEYNSQNLRYKKKEEKENNHD